MTILRLFTSFFLVLGHFYADFVLIFWFFTIFFIAVFKSVLKKNKYFYHKTQLFIKIMCSSLFSDKILSEFVTNLQKNDKSWKDQKLTKNCQTLPLLAMESMVYVGSPWFSFIHLGLSWFVMVCKGWLIKLKIWILWVGEKGL